MCRPKWRSRAVSFFFVVREHDKTYNQDTRARYAFKKQGPGIRVQGM